ncbi:MAG: DMT family transporter [Desulfohalobiaceae bacterium]|nr:DMT family transporter [Desulfohalobiaceae bacterium]MCF8086391.1 DMT family transporter [Desulfohalobiaceae bacterium]
MSWYLFALLAFFLIGTQRFLYKVAAFHGLSPSRTTFSFMLTVALLSGLLYSLRPAPLTSPAWFGLLALVNSASFVSATLAHIRALRRISAAVVFPVIRLNIVLVLLFSTLVLSERLSQWQWLGVGLSVLAFVLFSGPGENDSGAGGPASGKAWAQVGLATVAGAVASISCKLAAETGNNLLAFIALSYACSTGFSWLAHVASPVEGDATAGRTSAAVWLGVGIGVLNLAGFYCYLRALSLGPLAIVASINGMHFVVAVVLSALLYRERPSGTVLTGIGVTGAALVLLKGF